MVILGLTISTFLLLACWLWVFQHVFAGKSPTHFWRGLLGWGVGALIVVGVSAYFRQKGVDIYDTNTLTPLILSSILIIRSVLTRYLRHKLVMIGTFLCIILLWSYFAYSSLVASSLIAVVLAACLEEAIKFFAGHQRYMQHNNIMSDLLMRCLLSSLWFAFIENIIYLMQGIGFLIWRQHQLQRWAQLVFVRSLFGSRVHMLFGVLVARGVMQQLKTQHYRWSIVGILWGVLLHTLYNLSLQSASAFVLVGVLVVGYFVFSWLLFQTDRLYVQ